MGLIIGVELKSRVTPVLRGLMERGVLALPAGNTVLRFLPPLSINRAEIDQVVAATHESLDALGENPSSGSSGSGRGEGNSRDRRRASRGRTTALEGK